MVMISQDLPTAGNAHLFAPCGWDGGFGNSKLIVEGSEVRILSYLALLNNDNSYEVFGEGSLVEYVAGDRTELIGHRWLAGFPAYQEFPQSYLQIVDDGLGKIKYGLHLLLGAIGTLPTRSHWQLFIQASIQDAQVFGEDLKKAIEGRHVVKFNNRPASTVELKLAMPTEEGVGAVAQAYCAGLATPDSQVILLDIGHGTLIVSAFAPGGKLIRDSRKVIFGGVDSLVNAISKNKETRRKLHHEGEESIIRAAIERGDFLYGQTNWSFKEIYTTELKPWAQAVLVPGLKAIEPWRATSSAILGIGGGVNLPGISKLLEQQGITPIADSQFANVRGLAQLAKLQQRRTNGYL